MIAGTFIPVVLIVALRLTSDNIKPVFHSSSILSVSQKKKRPDTP